MQYWMHSDVITNLYISLVDTSKLSVYKWYPNLLAYFNLQILRFLSHTVAEWSHQTTLSYEVLLLAISSLFYSYLLIIMARYQSIEFIAKRQRGCKKKSLYLKRAHAYRSKAGMLQAWSLINKLETCTEPCFCIEATLFSAHSVLLCGCFCVAMQCTLSFSCVLYACLHNSVSFSVYHLYKKSGLFNIGM